MNWLRGFALLSCSLIGASNCLAQRHAVGFTSFVVRDSTRTWELTSEGRAAPRPVRVSVWYPARARTGTRMRVGDYLVHVRTAPDSETMRRLDERDHGTFVAQALGGDSASYTLAAATSVGARRGAAPLRIPAPLVLYSAGLNSFDADNAFLAESLASRGVIVATVAQLGIAPDRLDLTVGSAEVETQVRDLEVALAALRRRPDVDATRVGIAGWSMGAVAALQLLLRHPELKALAAIDPSFNYRDHPSRSGASPWFVAERVTAPVLVVEQHSADVTDAIIDSLPFATREVVRYPGVVHEDFTMSAIISASAGQRWTRRSNRHALLVHQDAMSRVVAFMVARLVGGAEPPRAVPQASQLPAGVVVQRHLAALPPPMVATRLALEVERVGFSATAERLALPGAPRVREAEVNSLAYGLLTGSRRATAVSLFRLNTQLFPRSANAFDSLADGLRASGDSTGMAQAYRRVLSLLAVDLTLTAATRETLRANATQFLLQFERKP